MADQERYLTWDQMTPGMTFRTLRRTITETDLVNFVNASGLFEPLFIDAPYVQERSPYGGRLVPAPLIYGYAEGLSLQGGGFQRSGLALLGVDITMVAPCLVGDTISVTIEVTESRPTKKPGRGVVTTTNTVANQRGETVMVYRPARLVSGTLIGHD
jgi:acyl dehydratase